MIQTDFRPLGTHGAKYLVQVGKRLDDLLVHGLGAQRVVGVFGVVHAEGGKAEGAVPQCMEEIAHVGLVVADLGDIQRIVIARVEIHDPGSGLVIAEIDIGGNHVDMRRRRFPDMDDIVGRAAAGILAGFTRVIRIAQGDIHIHGQWIFRLARCGNLVHIAADMPGVEKFIGIATEHVAPVTRFFIGIREQLFRYCLLEDSLRSLRVIPRGTVGAHLVLHLHHDHRALAIDFFQVTHQLHKRPLVRLECAAVVGRQGVQGFAILGLYPGKALVVQLDPRRGIVRSVVFPGGEPQQHQAHVFFPRLLDQGIDEGKIEVAFLRFHLFPGHRNHQGVRVHLLHHRPYIRQGGGVVGRVVGLGREQQVGLAIDHQGVAAITGLDVGEIASDFCRYRATDKWQKQ